MISAASNCCRIDSVKSSASQLRLKLAQEDKEQDKANADNSKLHAAQQRVQSLDAQIKTGDPEKAEQALAAAAASVRQLDYAALSAPTRKQDTTYGSLDVRA